MKTTWPEPFPGAHWLDAREERAVGDVLRRRSLFRYYGLSRPKHVAAFEARARQFYGVRHALAVNSGTAALMTAMTALGVGPGCEVIVPSFFWVATVGAVVQANAIPVLCEVDDSFTLDPADLERKISPRTRLIVAVHMAGAVCDLAALLAVARRHRVPLLEDCAQANGGTFRGRKVGTFGTLGMFSFQWNKNATAGEGGLLVTNDEALYRRCVAAHDLGIPWAGDAPAYEGPRNLTWGGGRRMSELCGAVAGVQLSKLPRIVGRMRASKRRIKRALSGVPGLSFRRLHDEAGDTGCFLIMILDSPSRARSAVESIRAAGLRHTCLVADHGMHVYSSVRQLVRQTPLSPSGNPWNLEANRDSQVDYRRGACPRSDAWFARSILLPIPSCLTPRQEAAGIQIFRKALARISHTMRNSGRAKPHRIPAKKGNPAHDEMKPERNTP